ncbi:MAG TPA: hypothetical protein VNE63_00390 [Candidatus Acidoferrales bacterium]|nr:hypothetical protein [Candidatus Acidoferrales bacterium]
MGKKLIVVLVMAGALLLPQLADCMSAMASPQSMKCCASMPCTPANQSHNCCKTMNAPKGPNMVLTARASLQAPSIISSIGYEQVFEGSWHVSILPVFADAQTHSPPELYTLHSSLLI